MNEQMCEMMTPAQDIHMQQVLGLAMEAGSILLRSGGEISRVEETIERICISFEIENVDVFVLSNGIFVTAKNNRNEIFAQVKSIPLAGIHLGIVTEINRLSREIVAGEVGLLEGYQRLSKIKDMPPNNNLFRVVGAGIGSACFLYLIGGHLWECLMTLLSGMAVFGAVILTSRFQVSKILVNMFGGAFITILALLYTRIFPMEMRLSQIIIGSIFPLIPGFAFTNAIKDINDSDFISGIVRLIDAVLVFVYIAIGVGVVLSGYERIFGGVF